MRKSLILIFLGALGLWFNSTYTACTGWQVINPLCWLGAFLTHAILYWTSIVFLVVGGLMLLLKKD